MLLLLVLTMYPFFLAKIRICQFSTHTFFFLQGYSSSLRSIQLIPLGHKSAWVLEPPSFRKCSNVKRYSLSLWPKLLIFNIRFTIYYGLLYTRTVYPMLIYFTIYTIAKQWIYNLFHQSFNVKRYHVPVRNFFHSVS